MRALEPFGLVRSLEFAVRFLRGEGDGRHKVGGRRCIQVAARLDDEIKTKRSYGARRMKTLREKAKQA